jgi:tRNA pseudouridine55 synthase
MFGFLNVNKSPGPTSHDVVVGIRRLLPRRTKVGHAGTLDPFAAGVLVICIGPATRLADRVQQSPKCYVAEITLGATSDTDDVEGHVTPTPGARAPAEGRLREVLAGLVGEIEQVPPAHSAVHAGGRRAYQLARRGEPLALAPRRVVVHAIDLVAYAWPVLRIEVRCGAGTYLRALGRDVGAAVGAGGYCSALQRTAVGPFTVAEAVAPEAVDPARHLLSPMAAVRDLPKAALDADAAARARHGNAVPSPLPGEHARVAVVDEAGRLLALAACRGGLLRPTRVFQQSPGRIPHK